MQTLIGNITAVYGKKGELWLQELPSFLAEMEKKLNIHLKQPFPNLTYNYVAPAFDKNDQPLVFKCGMPNKHLNSEIAALNFYAGKGAVNLINADAQQGWMLLEKCEPGTTLANMKNDDKATEIAITLMQQLWRVPKEQAKFQSVTQWLEALNNVPPHPIPAKMLENARLLAKQLLTSQSEPVLLHGDLHHENILQTTRAPWLAIDPKGVIGEREFEIGALLRNPYSFIDNNPNLAKQSARRLSIISEITGFDRERLRLWAFVQAVLSAIWYLQDNIDGVEKMIYCAHTFSQKI